MFWGWGTRIVGSFQQIVTTNVYHFVILNGVSVIVVIIDSANGNRDKPVQCCESEMYTASTLPEATNSRDLDGVHALRLLQLQISLLLSSVFACRHLTTWHSQQTVVGCSSSQATVQ